MQEDATTQKLQAGLESIKRVSQPAIEFTMQRDVLRASARASGFEACAKNNSVGG